MSADRHAADPAQAKQRVEAMEAAADYNRRVYASTREWYNVAEAKAQLLLTVNGVFVTILSSLLFSRIGNIHAGISNFGPVTWFFLGVSVAALVCALTCAAGCLWSWHSQSGKEFAQLGVNPGDPASYRPEVLWYFGHLARLQPDGAVERLRKADRTFEAETLSYNVVDLAAKVLRKHRLVNAGWALTALALISLVAAGMSFLIDSHL